LSMSLKYEPSSEPLQIYVKQLCFEHPSTSHCPHTRACHTAIAK